jgi:hypothetical protein
MARFDLDMDEFESLQQSMNDYGSGALKIINDVLHEEGGKKISDEIMKILPASGRTWKRKKAAARSTQPFTQEDGTLSVTVKTTNSYHYLYFPDDGSNTIRHMGNQQFMRQGGDSASGDIIDQCIGRLTEDF